jgi:NADPH-dependent curcumin reductase
VKSMQIQLLDRPGKNGPSTANFRKIEIEIGEPGDDEVLLETLCLSLDPYMRARMYEGANYANCVQLGDPMPGATISRILKSNSPGFPVGAMVESWHGWRSHHIAKIGSLKQIETGELPITTWLGALGLTGLTGYGGLLRYGRPRPAETVVVSAASGAVGSMAAQVARIKGARVVGIAGGERKCRYLTDELGLAAAVDYRASGYLQNLAAACSTGVDVYFDNVGGEIFASMIDLLNPKARVVVCGTISLDRNQPASVGPDRLQNLHTAVLVKQLSLNGFVFDGLADMTDDFRREVRNWIASGELRFREHIVEGLENAPDAFLGLFQGKNFGKLLVRVGEF